MRPGREIDARIAKEVFGYKVWAQNKVLFEGAPKGDRPLRTYSKDMQWAQDIIAALHVTLIPIEGGQWFVFVGPEGQEGWQSPQSVLEFLSKGPFDTCGAASGTDLPGLICEAALKAVEKRSASSHKDQHTGVSHQDSGSDSDNDVEAPPVLHS